MEFFVNSSFLKCSLFVFCLLGTEILAKLTSTELDSIIIKNVITTIDISTQLVNIEHIITVKSNRNNLKSFIFEVDPLIIDNLSYVTATSKEKINPVKSYGNVWEVTFERRLHEGDSKVVIILMVFTHVLKPFPNTIQQNEKHLVLYSGPVSLYTSYRSYNHTSFVTFGDGELESVIEPANFYVSKELPKVLSQTFVKSIKMENLANAKVLMFHSNLEYIQPNTIIRAKIHYGHKNPFLTVTKLHRTIEISHWGSIGVTEEIELENSGAKFTGPFHRNLYTAQDLENNVVKSFVTELPASVSGIRVYDEVGVISSIDVRTNFDCVEMKYSPRIILLGGWKVKYFVTYNVPSYEYLYIKDDTYKLRMRTVDHVFDYMVIDKAIIKVILPEGANQFLLDPPYPVSLMNQSYHISYLDTFGRPVISFSAENLIEEHIKDFVLTYNFSLYKLLFEPFYVILFIELFFIFIMIFNRIDFRISSNEIEEENSKPEVEYVPPVKVSNVKPKKRNIK